MSNPCNIPSHEFDSYSESDIIDYFRFHSEIPKRELYRLISKVFIRAMAGASMFRTHLMTEIVANYVLNLIGYIEDVYDKNDPHSLFEDPLFRFYHGDKFYRGDYPNKTHRNLRSNSYMSCTACDALYILSSYLVCKSRYRSKILPSRYAIYRGAYHMYAVVTGSMMAYLLHLGHNDFGHQEVVLSSSEGESLFGFSSGYCAYDHLMTHSDRVIITSSGGLVNTGNRENVFNASAEFFKGFDEYVGGDFSCKVLEGKKSKIARRYLAYIKDGDKEVDRV